MKKYKNRLVTAGFCLLKNFSKNMKKRLDFCAMVCYYIQALRESAGNNIRVWRSLVSRLNGVQEASSSNLDTRTKNTVEFNDSTVFF